MTPPHERWTAAHLDRRALERAEYRRTAPALLELDGCRCAVRDLGLGGLRVEPAPGGRVWYLGQQVDGTVVMRTGDRIPVQAIIGRIDRAGLAFFPDGLWPTWADIGAERTTLQQRHRERRSAPRLPIPQPAGQAPGTGTPLRDVSATGLRYALAPSERAPAAGSHVAGELRLDADTVIPVRGQVIRHVGREIAVALDPPGLTQDILALLQQRYFPE